MPTHILVEFKSKYCNHVEVFLTPCAPLPNTCVHKSNNQFIVYWLIDLRDTNNKTSNNLTKSLDSYFTMPMPPHINGDM